MCSHGATACRGLMRHPRSTNDRYLPCLFVQGQGPRQNVGRPLGPSAQAVVRPGWRGAHAVRRVTSRRLRCASILFHSVDQARAAPGRPHESSYLYAGHQAMSPRPRHRSSGPAYGPWLRLWIPACAVATHARDPRCPTVAGKGHTEDAGQVIVSSRQPTSANGRAIFPVRYSALAGLPFETFIIQCAPQLPQSARNPCSDP